MHKINQSNKLVLLRNGNAGLSANVVTFKQHAITNNKWLICFNSISLMFLMRTQ
ncbi:MAG: hypothetical protein V3U88_07680 [Methylococcales bacterium]